MMASAALAALLSLCLFFATGAQAWLATSYYEQSLRIYTDVYAGSTSFDTVTRQLPVKPTTTSFEPVSMETSIDAKNEMTVVNILVPTGVASVINAYDYYYSESSTTYYVDITMSANSARCTDTASWVWKTAFTIDVPDGVSPIPTAISTRTYQNVAFGPTTTYTTAYLNPSDVPASSLSSKSSSLEYYTSWIQYSCTVPFSASTGLVSLNGRAYEPTGTGASATVALASATATSDPNNPWAFKCGEARSTSSNIDSNGRYISGYYSLDEGYWYGLPGWGYYEWCDTNYDCACHRGLSWWALIPIVVGSWIFLCLVAGMLESWFRFRNLCRGRSARRGLPIAWTLILIPWTCFFLCCLKRGFTKKTPEEQALLTTQWKDMGAGKKLGRWLKWGFRYKYPTFLGQAPFRRTKWEEKDIAAQLEASRRLSVNAAPMALVPLDMVRQEQMAGPVVGQTPESYYKPQAPAQAYKTPDVGVATSDFAGGDLNRGIGRNRESSLPPVAEGPSPKLPARPVEAVSPVSPINEAQESIAEPAPKGPEGKLRAREDLRGNPSVGV